MHFNPPSVRWEMTVAREVTSMVKRGNKDSENFGEAETAQRGGGASRGCV